MVKSKILVVDDEEWIRNQLKWALAKDYTILLSEDTVKAKNIMAQENPDVVMLDISLTPNIGTGNEGITLLQEILTLDSTVKVIMITGNDTRENALKCIALGAYDFYSKPINIEEIRVSIKRAIYIQELERENKSLIEDLERAHGFGEIISNCTKMNEVIDIIKRVSTTDATVLIQGESGTGKELVARAIHYNSIRKEKPFVPINCGAIPENLLESELFGHEKGSFTDAYAQRKGKLEYAQNGTVFLDEIAELSLALQAKILRFLQEKEIERVGGRERIPVDVRVIAATNKNIIEEIKASTFRDDLYYRLSVISIYMPALRERDDDVILLANTFFKRFSREIKSDISGFNDKALLALRAYNWPGNVRELENRIKRAIIMTKGPYIIPEDLDLSAPEVSPDLQKQIKKPALKEARDQLELQYIKETLDRNQGNITHAAEQLGITRSTLYSLMDKYGLAHE